VKRLRGRLLDVGCGIGDMLAFRLNSVGVDINEQTVAYCRQRGHEARMMQPDRLPFESASFDSVLLDNVLEHIAEPAPLLAEVRRILPPGGRLLIGVPGVRGWQSDPDHKVLYDETTMMNRLGSAGFAPVEVFHTPLLRSDWMSRRLRQYCIYGAFDRA
jgi:SAM-dependent methyltransferase